MFFPIKNNKYLSKDRLRITTLLNAYAAIQRYPMRAQEMALDMYIQQQYETSLKNMCIKLLLSLTLYEDDDGFILLFKDKKYDQIASLITYGNGAIPGSQILKTALTN